MDADAMAAGKLAVSVADGVDEQVLRGMRLLQIDPVSVVARSHLLVLWSRLGRFDAEDLDTLLWRERWLFEYWAHAASIVLAEDYPIHSAMMRAYPAWTYAREYKGLDLSSCRWARPVRVEGGNEQWWVHREVLPLLDEEWVPRTTLLSPFDNLICDRARTERLWSFAFINEMYKPKQKRQFGYYVMPVLSGERLIGRVAPRVDRRRGVLVVEGVFGEAGLRSANRPGRPSPRSQPSPAPSRSFCQTPTPPALMP